MLVLTARKGDYIVVVAGGETIFLHINDMDRGKLRIGLEANQEVRFYRGEIWDQMVKQQKENPT